MFDHLETGDQIGAVAPVRHGGVFDEAFEGGDIFFPASIGELFPRLNRAQFRLRRQLAKFLEENSGSRPDVGQPPQRVAEFRGDFQNSFSARSENMPAARFDDGGEEHVCPIIRRRAVAVEVVDSLAGRNRVHVERGAVAAAHEIEAVLLECRFRLVRLAAGTGPVRAVRPVGEEIFGIGGTQPQVLIEDCCRTDIRLTHPRASPRSG